MQTDPDNLKKYQIFISSTYTDLIEERKLIIDALLKMDFIPSGMEMFVASNTEQFNVIKKVIDLCDYYLLIIGKRYGSINPTTQISYTEMEYNYALSRQIPILVFVLDKNTPVPIEKEECDPLIQAKLKSFRERAMNNRLATIWKSQTELALNVPIALNKLIKDFPAPRWVRADTIVNYQSKIIDDLQNKISQRPINDTTFPKDVILLSYPDLEKIDLAVLEIIYTNNSANITYSIIADYLGFSISSVKRHINKLINMKLILVQGHGKFSSLHTNFSSILSNFKFDYSNNNGEFVLGAGDHRFSTKWSKASNTSIHAYSDGDNIDSIGRIKNIESLDVIQMSDLESVDFSSRCRTAEINDVIVWKNKDGNIALTKVLSIKDDSRNDDYDEIECQYKIFYE